VVLFLCVTKGEITDGRLGIPGTDLINPNDLAFHLAWLSMFAVVFLMNRGWLGKSSALLTLGLAFWYTLKTGSRANFLTLFVVLAVVLIIVPRGARIAIALGAPVAVLLVLMVLPKNTLNRMLAIDITSSEEDVAEHADRTQDPELRGAIGSQAARMELQRLAVDATLRHPFLGVGPLMFENETADYIMSNAGERPPWQTAHNSYLKISSENGIVGFILYLFVILAAFRVTYRAYRNTQHDPELNTANINSAAILLALAVYAFGSLFSDIVYLSYLPITIGFAAANYIAVSGDMKKEGAPVEAPPAISPG